MIATLIKHKWILLFWLIVNLLQAFFTELHYDEAYYWMYSRDLAFGYFDHPPMVALLAKIGYSIFNNELGLRLLFVLLGVGTMWGIFHLLDRSEQKKEIFFFILSFPLMSIHAAGFLTLPDLPLVFFTVMFFIAYRRFLQQESNKNIILLSLIIACLMYSKYHGAWVLILTIASNIKLLSNKKFWIIVACSTLLYLPHILWQYNHDFVSFTFHIANRNSGFKISNITEFLSTQVGLSGGLASLFVVYFAFRFKPKDLYEKMLKYIAFGFPVFILLVCLTDRVEMHWIAAATPAVIIISYMEWKKCNRFKWIMPYLIIPTAILMFIARTFLCTDYFIDQMGARSPLHGNKLWSEKLDSIADGHPILFTDKYHNISHHSFYSNKVLPQAPHFYERYSQLDFNRIDSLYEGQKIFAFSLNKDFEWTMPNGRKYYGGFINDYYPCLGIEIEELSLRNENGHWAISGQLTNTLSKERLLDYDAMQGLKFVYRINNSKYISSAKIKQITAKDKLLAGEKISFDIPTTIEVDTTLPKQNIQLIVSTHKSLRVFDTRFISFNTEDVK